MEDSSKSAGNSSSHRKKDSFSSYENDSPKKILRPGLANNSNLELKNYLDHNKIKVIEEEPPENDEPINAKSLGQSQ